MAQEDPYKDVREAAEQLTKARLEAGKSGAEKNDLVIQPLVQAVTPADEASKRSNTGGVSVKGSPDAGPVESSDGFVDTPPTDLAKSSKGGK